MNKEIILHTIDSTIGLLRDEYGKSNCGGDDFEEATAIENLKAIRRWIVDQQPLPAQPEKG